MFHLQTSQTMEIISVHNQISSPTFEDLILNTNVSTSKPFIEANTIELALDEIRNKHIIPVFVKDNEPLISHVDFIETLNEVVFQIYKSQSILSPSIRVSHPIKGRIPEARYKPAKELLEHEQTLYYERLAFVIEIPTIHETIDGNLLTLTVGGIKAYNLDNIYSKKGSDEVFKIFIGFQNKVCTNLCVWSDGYVGNLKVRSLKGLRESIYQLISQYEAEKYLKVLSSFSQYSLNEHQFAQLIGKCRLYNYLPSDKKRDLPQLYFGDTQIRLVAKDYYKDNSFCKNPDGSISLWKVYNLFTGANKSSYIDTFIDRGVNAFEFTNSIVTSLQSGSNSWFLN